MKKIYIFVLTCLLPVFMIAQANDAFNYQAVVRDHSGQVLANKTVNFRISLLLDRPNGMVVYSETHLAMTNDFGLVSLEIGHGISVSGDFSKINWSVNNYFIETAIDTDGGISFEVLGASKLLSVPYALYAKNAGNTFSGDYNDLVNKPQYISSFINDQGYLTLTDLQSLKPGDPAGITMAGVPSQTWSLFGNSNSDPAKDKLGTTDYKDLVLVTNNLERLRIKANGDIDLTNSLQIGKDLTVNENVYLNTLGGETHNYGPLTVENNNATYLTGSLDVDGPTSLNSTLDVDGATTLNNTLDVDGASALHSTLEVDGNADLNSDLNVDGNSSLNGTLDVDGATTLNSTLDVDGAATLNNTLDVDGATTLNSTLNAAGATTLGSTLVVTGASTFNNAVGLNGQVTINANVSGGDGSYDAYPLRVQGSEQGIAVKVTGTRDSDKNFITFWDGDGRQGRIEGQTLSELQNSFDYIWFHTQEALQTAFQIAMVIVDVIGVDDIDASVVEGIELVDIIANWAVMAVDWEDNVGVAFESGSGDYAEWLEKANNSEIFSYGDIVGVSGGKISKSMENPDFYMVVSMSPIILGNMPPIGTENQYEKVAFMGQVPVKVRGKAEIGDYILASSLDDGFGIAVHPKEMAIGQYDRIVGVAWSATAGNNAFSYINTAVGVNTNDLTAEISRQQAEIESMKSNMNGIVSYLKSKDADFDATIYETEQQSEPVEYISKQKEKSAGKAEAFDRLFTHLQEKPEILQQILADARKSLDEKGIDYNKYEQTRRLVTDEAYFLETLRSSMQ